MKTVKRSRLNPIFDESINKKYPTVIDTDNHVKHYVGIGWVDHGEATAEDKRKYPQVVD